MGLSSAVNRKSGSSWISDCFRHAAKLRYTDGSCILRFPHPAPARPYDIGRSRRCRQSAAQNAAGDHPGDRVSRARLEALVEEATVDAYGDAAEPAAGRCGVDRSVPLLDKRLPMITARTHLVAPPTGTLAMTFLDHTAESPARRNRRLRAE